MAEGGEPVRLGEPGPVTLVDFWATHCGPCEKAFPELQALAREHGGKVRVIAVSEDDEREVIAPFLARTGVRFTVLWDQHKDLARAYRVDAMPTTFLIDRRGVVRHVHRGYHADERSRLAEEVRGLLAE